MSPLRFGCCFGPSKKQREAEIAASQEARSKAAEAAQRRQLEFEKSAAGKAAKAQIAAIANAKKSHGEMADGVMVLNVPLQLPLDQLFDENAAHVYPITLEHAQQSDQWRYK